MGYNFIDEYSLLHFAVGIVAYYWNISLGNWIITHILFELLENTQQGMYIINYYFHGFWPGGKDHPDSWINSFGDTFFAILGWFLAQQSQKYFGIKNINPILLQ